MDSSKKYRINQWVEDALYTFLEEIMTHGQITPADAATLTPLIQMYQAIQLDKVCDEFDNLWHLFADGHASIYINTPYSGIDVNVKQKSQDEPQPPKKTR